jgi:integrase
MVELSGFEPLIDQGMLLPLINKGFPRVTIKIMLAKTSKIHTKYTHVMANIYQRNNSKIYHVSYYVKDENGNLREVRKSTGKTNKKEALQVAVEYEQAANASVLRESTEAEGINAIFTRIKQDIALSKFTVVSARQYLNEITALVTGEQLTTFTIKSWCNEWIRRKERKSSKATMARYNGHAKAFLAYLGDDRTEKPLESVTASDMEAFKQYMIDKGLTGKTVLSYTKDISAIYRSAIREGLIVHNPMGAIEAPDTADSQERKPFTTVEVQLLIDSAPCEEWRGLILAAAYTGLRLGDVAKLKWSSVDLEGKWITLMPAKTIRKKREVKIPIQPDLLAFFTAATITDDEPDAYVFPELARLGIGHRGGLSRNFISIMEKAGVSRGKPSRVIADDGDDDKPNTKGAGYVTYERGFHSLRHTFTTWLRTEGVSEEDRMALTGHSTRDSHSIYSHADESVLRNAGSKLPSLPSKKKPTA